LKLGSKHQIQLINQALSAAVSSINLAKQLLREVEAASRVSPRDLPGVEGKFDGEAMVTAEGKKYPVPENYASKSLLVVGDTLKMITEGDRKLFKQLERVKRTRSEGILTKKEGKWHVVTADGSYRILPAAVTFHHGEEGDEVAVLLPQDNKRVGFAALEKLVKGAEEEKTSVREAKTKPRPTPKAPRTRRVEKKAEEKPKPQSKNIKKTVRKEPAPAESAKPSRKRSPSAKSKTIPEEGDLR